MLPSKLEDSIQRRIQSEVKHRGGSAIQKRCSRTFTAKSRLSRNALPQRTRAQNILFEYSRLYRDFAPAFFRTAQRAFMRTANFFRAAGLIGLRAGFLAAGAAFLARDLPFRCAHLIFIAAEIRLRAAGLIVRLRSADLGGRPRRGLDPSRA